MPEQLSASQASVLDGPVPEATQELSDLSPTSLWDVVWRPRRGLLEGRYYGETQERAARLFAEEAARLQLLGYRPSSVIWSAERAFGRRRRWHRKDGRGFLVVTYLAPGPTSEGSLR